MTTYLESINPHPELQKWAIAHRDLCRIARNMDNAQWETYVTELGLHKVSFYLNYCLEEGRSWILCLLEDWNSRSWTQDRNFLPPSVRLEKWDSFLRGYSALFKSYLTDRNFGFASALENKDRIKYEWCCVEPSAEAGNFRVPGYEEFNKNGGLEDNEELQEIENWKASGFCPNFLKTRPHLGYAKQKRLKLNPAKRAALQGEVIYDATYVSHSAFPTFENEISEDGKPVKQIHCSRAKLSVYLECCLHLPSDRIQTVGPDHPFWEESGKQFDPNIHANWEDKFHQVIREIG